ncbi:MAG: glycosyltransferase family 2 protein [Polaromonas sp.]|nr:glycosyltransferase family 2 protein [Polaromonas sp.]MDI1270362.1 glycosyltransferase family 2 protein [Polaromonas sp.]
MFELSICIATLNRARFIGKTLDSIVDQIEDGVQLVIVDGASPDNTAEVMAQYCARYPQIVYRRELTNSGVDADYDKAVAYATGKYCWLMTDDDLLKPGAIQRVLTAMKASPDLIVVNAEVRSADLSVVMEKRRLDFLEDVCYSGSRKDEFLREVGSYLSFIGCVVIKREKWMTRERPAYYGSLFIHVGVIFQKPSIDDVLVISDPLIEIRYGNAMWTPRGFEIWMFKWPQLIWSFPEYSDDAKRAVCRKQPWRSVKALFHQRAMGSYSINEFRKFWPESRRGLESRTAWLISRFPASAANFIMVLYFSLRAKTSGMALYDLLHSRHATAASFRLAKAFGVKPLS